MLLYDNTSTHSQQGWTGGLEVETFSERPIRFFWAGTLWLNYKRLLKVLLT